MSKERNVLFDQLGSGEFIVSAQIDPPSEIPPDQTLEKLYEEIPALKGAGIKVIDVNSSRRLSHDSISLSYTLSKDFSLEVIPHITPRDASLLGVMRQIVSASKEIKNFLIIRGDPHEESETSKNVFHSDAVGLISAIDINLRKPGLGLDLKLGAALNQYNGLLHEAERIKLKEEVGTNFFMSQPVFDKKQTVFTNEFFKKYSSAPLILGVWPIISPRTLESIHAGKIAGVVIPEEVYEEYKAKTDPEELREYGVFKAVELIKYIKAQKLANGVYVVAPFRKPSQIAELITKLNRVKK